MRAGQSLSRRPVDTTSLPAQSRGTSPHPFRSSAEFAAAPPARRHRSATEPDDRPGRWFSPDVRRSSRGGEETRRMADSCHRHHVVQRRRIPAFTGQQIHASPGRSCIGISPGRARPPLTITASTLRKREARSRIGPAGNHQPLPKRRTPSITTISLSRASL